MAEERVAHTGHLATSDRFFADLLSGPLLIIRQQDQYYALDAICSHADFGLEDGEIQEGAIVCPLHGARFCLKTGSALSAPATRPLKTYPVRVDSEGYIWVDLSGQ